MRLFGTNGIRGVVNEDMTSEFALKIGLAIGNYLEKKSTVAVGTDTRLSNDMIKLAVGAGLMSTGHDILDLGMSASPVIQFATKNHADFGVIISASHNPPKFNGIKCVGGDGTELDRNEEIKIEENFFSDDFKISSWDCVGKIKQFELATEEYLNRILSLVDVEKIKNKNFKVILDCANGAGIFGTPSLLQKLGCKVITLNAQPDGSFPGHESEPKKENIGDLMDMVKISDADIGMVHDGDADRIIFVDNEGCFIDGDKILALFAKKIVEKVGGVAVTTIATSSAFEEVVNKSNGKVEYTKVGAPIVARKMIEINGVFGGEENGGFIFPEHQYCRDGGMAAAKILEILADSEMSLSQLIGDLPKYYLKKVSIECPNDIKDEVINAFKLLVKDKNFTDIDGVKIFEDGGWVLIRPSGTEPIYRVYAESKDATKTDELNNKYADMLREVVQSKRIN